MSLIVLELQILICVTDVESVRAPKGLNKEVIEFISKQKKEPQWLLEWRLKAFERLQSMTEPNRVTKPPS